MSLDRETQKEWVKRRLDDAGEISRNECLANYISRLGAIIASLKNDGYRFVSFYRKTAFGRDYVYKLKKDDRPLSFSDQAIEELNR